MKNIKKNNPEYVEIQQARMVKGKKGRYFLNFYYFTEFAVEPDTRFYDRYEYWM